MYPFNFSVKTFVIIRFHNKGTKTHSVLVRSLSLKTGARIMMANLQVWTRNSRLRLRRSSSSIRYMMTWPSSMVGPQAGIGTRHLHTMRTTGTTTVIPWVVTHFSDLGNSATFTRKSPSQLRMDTFISVVKLPAAITPGSRGLWIRHGDVFGKFSPRTELRSKRKTSGRRIRTSRYLTTRRPLRCSIIEESTRIRWRSRGVIMALSTTLEHCRLSLCIIRSQCPSLDLQLYYCMNLSIRMNRLKLETSSPGFDQMTLQSI